jgi:hypothetical protein
MKHLALPCILGCALACARVEQEPHTQPSPAVDETTAPAAPTVSPVERPALKPAKQLIRGPLQAGYRTTSVLLQDGSELDAGDVELVINAAQDPPTASLRVAARGGGKSLTGHIVVNARELVAGGDVLQAAADASLVQLKSEGRDQQLDLSRLELERFSAEGRRSQLQLHAFGLHDAWLGTLTTQFHLTCLTTPESLGEKPNGEVGREGAPATIVVPDLEMRSEACAPFLRLL